MVRGSGPCPAARTLPYAQHRACCHPHCWPAGQTTELGDPKPQGKRQGAGGAEGSENVDPRAEMPLPDKTGQYGAVGAISGVILGWASQFF